MTEEDLKRERTEIEDGKVVKDFLATRVSRDMLERLKERNYTAFREAKTPDAITLAHAKGQVLDDFCVEMVRAIAIGEAAEKFKEVRDEREKARSKKP